MRERRARESNLNPFRRLVQFSIAASEIRGIPRDRAEERDRSTSRGWEVLRGFAAQDGKGLDPGFGPKEEPGSCHEFRSGEAFPQAEDRASASAHHGKLGTRFLSEPVSGRGEP